MFVRVDYYGRCELDGMSDEITLIKIVNGAVTDDGLMTFKIDEKGIVGYKTDW